MPVETASPRGRLALIKGLEEGRLAPTRRLAGHLDLCLVCRACETACPAHLPFGQAMEEARAILRESVPPPFWVRAIERLVLEGAFASPRALAWLVRALDLYHASGMARLASGPLAGLVPGRLARAARLLPRPDGPRPPPPAPVPPLRAPVAFLAGCVADHYLARTNHATLVALAANGYPVVLPGDAGCCGALHVHRGMRGAARAFARRTIEAFEPSAPVPVVTNSAGCGSALREYPHLLAGDPIWQERALAFAARVRDATELLASCELRPPAPVARLVAYDDPCHLLHAQGVSEAPRRLLAQVRSLVVVPLPESDWCCGAAGLYCLTHTDMALAVLARKVTRIVELAPQAVLTANPGCLLHLRAGLAGHGIRAGHVMDLLAEGYAGAAV
jgi:glycolate oxidase iron-sulfur subunit